MSSHQLSLSIINDGHPKTPVHAAFSAESDILVVLHEHGQCQVWDLHTRLGPEKGKVMDPVLLVERSLNETSSATTRWRQVTVLPRSSEGTWPVAVIGQEASGRDVISLLDTPGEKTISVEKGSRLLQNSPSGSLWLQSAGGKLTDGMSPCVSFRIPSDPQAALSGSSGGVGTSFTEFCAETHIVRGSSSPIFVGLSSTGRLHICSTSGGHHVLGTNVTSFTCASDFIIYTTFAHEAHFASVSDVVTLLSSGDVAKVAGSQSQMPEWEKRRIERGARIVCAVPSALALVLQMPRGNLETIAPRPMVMAVVKRDIAASVFINLLRS
jgi:elongator complex protein 1